MKLSEFGTVAGLVSAISVGGTIAAYKPPQPPCEINKQALDAIKDQNKQLFDSNKDIRNALENLPKDAQEFVKERARNAEKQRELDERLQAAEEARKAYEKAAKDTPCNPEKTSSGGLSTSGILLGMAEKKSR